MTAAGRPALLVIDVQQGFDDPGWGHRNNPDAENNIAKLLDLWRRSEMPVIHAQHCSLEPDSVLGPDKPGCRFKKEAEPLEGEAVFKKSVNSAFIGTGLEAYLREKSIDSIVVAGLTTDHCVSTTVRMAGNLGFRVWLAIDATATFDKEGPNGKRYKAEEIHDIHIASLNVEFCEAMTTAQIISRIDND